MNDYRSNETPMERSQSLLNQLIEHPLKEPWTVRRDRLRKLLAAGGDFQVKNDLATALAHTGEAAEAVKLLEQVEAEKPGLYFTAANLGTAYELSGDDRKALEWIRKGIERNPDAHDGTEWLHVRILEAKLALAKDPKWLEAHSILGSPAGEGPATQALGNRGQKVSIDQVKSALVYQLHERMQFVTPPNAVVGSLLLDLGDVISREPVGIGGAFDIFGLASEYLKALPENSVLAARVQARMETANRAQRSSETRPGSDSFQQVLLGMALTAVTAWIAVFLAKKVAQSRVERE